MLHIPVVGAGHWKSRLYLFLVYSSLIVMGITMVFPFLITLTGSTSNAYDYHRYQALPRFLTRQEDRYVKGLVPYFNGYRGYDRQLRAYFPEAPATWSSWLRIGEDVQAADTLARNELKQFAEHAEAASHIAADYREFTSQYPLDDMVISIDPRKAHGFLRRRYEALAQSDSASAERDALGMLSKNWGIPLNSIYSIRFDRELYFPYGFQTWFPPLGDPKYEDFQRIKDATRQQSFFPGLENRWRSQAQALGLENTFPGKGPDWEAFLSQEAPALMALPFAMRSVWYDYLETHESVRQSMGLDASVAFRVEHYNRLAGTAYQSLWETPFPLPASSPPELQDLWKNFLCTQYPLRQTRLRVDESLQSAYADFLRNEIRHLRVANDLLDEAHEDWSDFRISSTPPVGPEETDRNRLALWTSFSKTLDVSQRDWLSSEAAYQTFLLERYGNLEGVNEAYGWNLAHIEEAFPPFATAYSATFRRNEWNMILVPLLDNYRMILEFLIGNGRAITVTFILVALTVLATLTINPLCAYALSRFGLPGKQRILLFMLATMAFPAMVSAIPAYLLMRDLNLLNTFFALVLPGAANGMAIFILKGFFDSLPKELFEAATIDGAGEVQIFRMVAMPMVKPILAINSVSAFMAAYNGWQWALIICQDQDMWTLAVWMYQASQWWKNMPWIVSAGFVVVSIPTMIVFLSCQRIILKGIAIPSMK